MFATFLNKSFLSVLTVTSIVSSVALAQLKPGPPGHGGGGGNPPPKYNPCQVPSDPNCHKGGGQGGGYNPGHGGGYLKPDPKPYTPPYTPPSQPGYLVPGPTYPTYPYEPAYPTYPSNPGQCAFIESEYLNMYPDVRAAVYRGDLASGYEHYIRYGRNEGRAPSYGCQGGGSTYDNKVIRRISFNRAIKNQSLNLRQLAGLGGQFDGYKVLSVSASTTPNSPATTIAQLLVKGFVMASERNPGHEIYLVPQERVRLDQYSNLVLAITGSTFIHDIQIELTR